MFVLVLSCLFVVSSLFLYFVDSFFFEPPKKPFLIYISLLILTDMSILVSISKINHICHYMVYQCAKILNFNITYILIIDFIGIYMLGFSFLRKVHVTLYYGHVLTFYFCHLRQIAPTSNLCDLQGTGFVFVTYVHWIEIDNS